MENQTPAKKNWGFIIGILILCVGMQFANYGTAVCMSGEVAKMDAMQYYVLIAALGTLGMVLVLPIVGKLTAILGQRNMIVIGIIIQLAGRILMMFTTTWIPYGLAYLLQSIGGGFYVSCAYVLMPAAVEAHERAKFFGYIAVANAIGAIVGPMIVSSMYAAGGIVAKLAYVSNLPLAVIGFLMVMGKCPNSKVPGAAKGFDFLGLILTVIGLACMVLWMNLGGKMFQWLSASSIIMLALTLVCLIWMIRRELTIDNPAVPIRMFRNKRLIYAFIGSLVAAAYSTCSGSYCVMWIRMNFGGFPGTTFFNGTATMAQQIVILILGFFVGAYVGRKFVKRFRIFGILSMDGVYAANLYRFGTEQMPKKTAAPEPCTHQLVVQLEDARLGCAAWDAFLAEYPELNGLEMAVTNYESMMPRLTEQWPTPQDRAISAIAHILAGLPGFCAGEAYVKKTDVLSPALRENLKRLAAEGAAGGN